MSQTLAPPRPNRPAPRRPRPGPVLPSQLEAWRVEFFRAQGWKGKAEAQGVMQDEMRGFCDNLEAGVLPADGPKASANLDPKRLKAGKEFRAYMAALKDFEAAAIPRDPQLVATLREAAQGYLTHYAKHPKFMQKDKVNVEKRDLCQNTLAELKKYALRDDFDALGAPPWDSATAMKAASLKTTMDLESLPNGKQAEELGGSHAYPAFWINKDGPNGKADKTFLFKPASTEKIPGIPSGGTAPREAIAGRAADLIGAMSGLDLGVPETQIISLSKSRLPDGSLSGVTGADDPSQPDVVGSLQQFAPTQGGLRNQTLTAREGMPAGEVQKIILLDMVTLNLDRHADNMLLQDQEDGTQKLVPIDHGLSLPGFTAASNGTIADKLGNPNFTATMAMPGAHEKFTPEMLTAIGKLQPQVYAEGMKKEVAAIGEAHPQTQGQITDEAIEMSRRSMMFLKLGAPKLTAAALQVFFGQNAKTLLDPTIDDREFLRRATQVVDAAATQQDGLRDFMQMAPDERGAIVDRLKANGWPMRADEWVLANPKDALAYYHGNILHPGKLAMCEAALGKEKTAAWLKSVSLNQLSLDLSGIAKGNKALMDNDGQADFIKMKQDFPNGTPRPGTEGDWVAAWRKVVAVGGMRALEDAIQALALPEKIANSARIAPTTALEMIELAARYPGLGAAELKRLEDWQAAFPKSRIEDDNKARADTLALWDQFLQLGGEPKYLEAMEALKEQRAVNVAEANALLERYGAFQPADEKTLKEIEDLRTVFPSNKAYAESPLAALKAAEDWRRLQALGGVKALDELLAKSIGGAPRPKLVAEAVTLLESADAMVQATIAAGQRDLVKAARASEIDYVRSLLQQLPNNGALTSKLDQFVQAMPQDQKAAQKALHALKLEVMDALLDLLRLRITAIDKRIDRYASIAAANDDKEIGFIEEDFALPRANVLAGVFQDADSKIDEIGQRLDSWRQQQQPDPG